MTDRPGGVRPARRRVLSACVAIAAGLLLPVRTGHAELPRTLLGVKPSVVAVGTFQRNRNPSFQFLGTGFAVADGRLIATNAHVVSAKLATDALETLAIAVPSGDGGTAIAVRPARLVVQETARDLALLAIDGAPLPPLKLASSQYPVNEGQDVAFTGFPIGNALGFFPVTHRGIVASITPIGIPQDNSRALDPALIRRLGSDPFRVYQLDATAYPGNSGSPVYDPTSGEVIGVINMVFVKSTKEKILSDPSGISYAIPVEYLVALIGKAR